MMRRNAVIVLAFFTALGGSAQAAVPRRGVSDDRIVALVQFVAKGKNIEVYQHGVVIDPAFLDLMETAYRQVEQITGLKFDTATLGPTVRVYVSDAVPISHVWRGYQHATDPKAIIFLNLRAYQGAMGGANATYVHELTHLFTWRYHSHTLREGIADYVALKMFPGAAVGPNPGGDSARREIPAEVLDHLGTTKPPPDWLSTDPSRRAAYYYASYRLVKHLVESKDMETFWKLFRSENPQAEIKPLYGSELTAAV